MKSPSAFLNRSDASPPREVLLMVLAGRKWCLVFPEIMPARFVWILLGALKVFSRGSLEDNIFYNPAAMF